MSIKISNKNKIKNSIIGDNNIIQTEKKKINILVDIIIPILVGLVIAGIVFYIGWN